MTITELENILSTTDMEKISEELKRRGFRITNEHSMKEFPLNVIFANFMLLPKVLQFDELKNEKYYGTIYTNLNEFEGITFITVTRFVFKAHSIYKPAYVPVEGMTFTDAPYNNEFIEEINSVCKCDICKNVFLKKDMVRYNEQILCDDCYVDKIDID